MTTELSPREIFIQTYRAPDQAGGWLSADPRGVHVVHLPTHLIASCHESKSVHKNKAMALEALERELRRKGLPVAKDAPAMPKCSQPANPTISASTKRKGRTMSQKTIPVQVTFGADIAAYVTTTVYVPTGADIAQYLRENGMEIIENRGLVFDPADDTIDSFRVVEARADDKTVAEDIGLALRPHDRGLMASLLIQKHWGALTQALPADTVNEFAQLLEV
ncbi:peptide chain release factor family protein [Chromobacterium phragmitis]|uniref:Uncharacterized protein n=1 Tax=Chromobacterium phragmitis TaxID=2202141 RepID=A0ABV0J0T4_9NEIS